MQMMQCKAWLQFYPHIARRGSKGCNHIAHFNVRCCTDIYHTHLATISSNAYQRGECKCKCCNVCTSCTSYPIVLQKIWNHIHESKENNFKFHIVWLVWDNKNLVVAIQTTKPKHVDQSAMFTCLYRSSWVRAKHNPMEHHLITSKTQYHHHHTNNTLHNRAS
jgi:hypothetical protein